MAQPPSYENKDLVFLITTRTIASRLWFLRNKRLEEAVLSYLAKYQSIYGVIIYGFIIMGNHYHLLARFPNANRAKFMRSFNAIFAKLVKEYVPEYPGGRLWGKRYAFQAVPNPEDVLNWFMYLSLNPISSGVTQDLRKFDGYNSFFDAIRGEERKFTIIERKRFNDLNRFNPNTKIEDFTKEYTLTFARIPEKENLNEKSYYKIMMAESEVRTEALIKERERTGRGFAKLSKTFVARIGARPRTTKVTSRYGFRPLVLTLCKKTKQKFLDFYFALVDEFREKSRLFRKGYANVLFPPGTYMPSLVSIA